jgi:signal transduction histidine kinase
LLTFIPILFRCIGPFQRGLRHAKQRIAVKLAAFISLFVAGGISTCLIQSFSLFSVELHVYLMFNLALLAVSLYAGIFVIESVKEKQLLHHQLQHMSLNYRNEVQKLQQFIDFTPLAVLLTDKEGYLTHINENAMIFLMKQDSGREKLIGRSFMELGSETMKSSLSKLLLGALSGDPARSEIGQENQKIYIKTAYSVRDMRNNEIIGAALIAHDITEVTRLKDEIGRMDRLSLVGQMAASITHEIRNPMAVIRGFVQLMRERSPSHQQEYFRIIMDELDRANGIINDFLSLAQNRVIEKELCSLHSILEELKPLLWADANLRGQSIEMVLDSELPMTELNPKEIKQLILNLARNGMEAMGEKGVLTISTRNLPDAIQLCVTDSGVGIPKEKLENLFEPFYTTKTRGTGLGLALCLSITERHGGVIEVDSMEGRGTTLKVTFSKTRSD